MSSRSIESPPTTRIVALLPTFDNARTLGRVIDGVLALGVPVLVVDDGSTDATADVLARCGDRILSVRHPINRGKAAALRTGFAQALAAGFTHAVTVDTDGQHDPADLPALIELAHAKPRTLVLGVRDTALPGYPRANRLGRWAANTLVRFESGLRVADSQCGLRVYPLASITKLRVRSGRYGYETEVLTRAHWAGIPVAQTPVRCVYDLAGGRVSHYRPWVDTLRAVRLHARLLALTLVRWLNPRPALRLARRDAGERRRIAAAVAVGVLIGNLPVFGLQTLLSVAAAQRLRLQPLAVVAGSHVSTPPVGPVLIALAIGVGHWLVHGTFATPSAFDPRRIGYVECLRRVAVEWTIGSVVCGVVLGAAAYAITRLALRYGLGTTPEEASGPLSRVLTGEG